MPMPPSSSPCAMRARMFCCSASWRDIVHPARVAHGAPERLQRRFLVDPDHGADAGEGPIGRGAIVQDAAMLRLAAIPGGDRQHARFEIERRRDAVEGLHAVCRNRLAMGVKVDEARRNDQPTGIDHPLGTAEPAADRDDLAINDGDVRYIVVMAFRIDDAPTRNQESAHTLVAFCSSAQSAFTSAQSRRGNLESSRVRSPSPSRVIRAEPTYGSGGSPCARVLPEPVSDELILDPIQSPP
jgi:hypothetical protein